MAMKEMNILYFNSISSYSSVDFFQEIPEIMDNPKPFGYCLLYHDDETRETLEL